MTSPSEGQPGGGPAHPTQHDQLYAMVELAQICHFCGTFQTPLKLPVFSRTDLQAALVAGTTGDDREIALLAEVHFKLVREQGAKLERMIQDWERAVIRKVTDNWRLEFSSNPFDGAVYDDLTVAQRIQVLNALCHWKLESCAEIQKHLSTLQKEADPKALEALRATPIGYDDAGAAYWYFGDCCWVYAEELPEWQSHGSQQYAVEFADAKRIRLSINFDPTRSSAPLLVDSVTSDEIVTTSHANGESAPLPLVEGSSTPNKMEITTLVEEIEEDDEIDESFPIKKTEEILIEEPLPTTKTEEILPDESVMDEKTEAVPSEVSATNETPVVVTTPPPPPPPPLDTPSQSRKMDITMLCGSPVTAETTSPPSKVEPMEEDEHDVSEGRFMSTIVSTREPVKVEPTSTGEVIKEQDPKLEESDRVDNGKMIKDEEMVPELKKRRLSEEHVDPNEEIKLPTADQAKPLPPKRRKTRFHDIIRVSDNTSLILADKVIHPASTTVLRVDTGEAPLVNDVSKEPTTLAVAVDIPTKDGVKQDEDFDIMCAACQRSYDRRYLDPPLDKRPLGEWRCFECLVNDARGWPRRRNPTSKSPKGGTTDASEEGEETGARKKSPSSSKRSSKSKSKSSKSSSSGSKSSKSSSKKKSSSSSRSSSSTHKKSSGSSSKKASKKHKKSSSSSSSKHHSSSHHHNRHKEEFAKLLTLADGRKRERQAIEEERLNGAHLCPVSLDGPTDWRVVCCSVEGLRQVIAKLVGGSLEQDRLRGRLISILKVEEKMETERLKKREQQLWQVLPRRQSSRVAINRIKNSGESASDSDDDTHDHGGDGGGFNLNDRHTPRSARLRNATNGHDSRDRLARDRESRAKRRRLEDRSDSDSESDQGAEPQAKSVDGWIHWPSVKGDNSLTLVCSSVIDRLLKEEISELFARPVDPEEDGCPDYLTVIQQPMDLGTIRKRVTSGFYTTWVLFKTDVDRVWTNCRQYNSADMVVVEYADALDDMFKQMRKEAERHGVRKMGKREAEASADSKAVEGDNQESSDEASVKDKAKSDSSASEVSSDDTDESSDANSGGEDDEDEDDASPGKRKTRNRTSGKSPSARPSRASPRPRRPSRSSKPASSTKKPTRSSRRKATKHSDSEEEEEADQSGDSEEDEEMVLDSDDSDEAARSRPRRGRESAKRSEALSSTPRGAASPEAKAKPTSGSRNRIHESSDSSSSEASFKRDDSSSSSDSDDAEENENETENPPTPAEFMSSSAHDKVPPEPTALASAPPPPSSPPPPPPPSSTTNSPHINSTSRKPKHKPPVSTASSRTSPTALLNPYQSPASSSSYFSSSDSESSGNGSDSSDSD